MYIIETIRGLLFQNIEQASSELCISAKVIRQSLKQEEPIKVYNQEFDFKEIMIRNQK